MNILLGFNSCDTNEIYHSLSYDRWQGSAPKVPPVPYSLPVNWALCSLCLPGPEGMCTQRNTGTVHPRSQSSAKSHVQKGLIHHIWRRWHQPYKPFHQQPFLQALSSLSTTQTQCRIEKIWIRLLRILCKLIRKRWTKGEPEEDLFLCCHCQVNIYK